MATVDAQVWSGSSLLDPANDLLICHMPPKGSKRKLEVVDDGEGHEPSLPKAKAKSKAKAKANIAAALHSTVAKAKAKAKAKSSVPPPEMESAVNSGIPWFPQTLQFCFFVICAASQIPVHI